MVKKANPRYRTSPYREAHFFLQPHRPSESAGPEGGEAPH